MYYDGCAMIVINGRIVAQAPQFDVQDVNVIAATVDLEDVRSYRASHPAFGIQAAKVAAEEGGGGSNGIICEDFQLTFDPLNPASVNKSRPKITDESMALKVATPEEECCMGPACWLWDYLRRSGGSGFFLPLSGEFSLPMCMCVIGLVGLAVEMMKPKQQKEQEQRTRNLNGAFSVLRSKMLLAAFAVKQFADPFINLGKK